MPRQTKDGQPLDSVKYRQEWNKKNMKSVAGSYRADFVDEYKAVAKKLGLKTSDLIRQMVQDTIDKANQQ